MTFLINRQIQYYMYASILSKMRNFIFVIEPNQDQSKSVPSYIYLNPFNCSTRLKNLLKQMEQRYCSVEKREIYHSHAQTKPVCKGYLQ